MSSHCIGIVMSNFSRQGENESLKEINKSGHYIIDGQECLPASLTIHPKTFCPI